MWQGTGSSLDPTETGKFQSPVKAPMCLTTRHHAGFWIEGCQKSWGRPLWMSATAACWRPCSPPRYRGKALMLRPWDFCVFERFWYPEIFMWGTDVHTFTFTHVCLCENFQKGKAVYRRSFRYRYRTSVYMLDCFLSFTRPRFQIDPHRPIT